MRIEHRLDDFLYEIFPEVPREDTALLTTRLERFYTFGAYKPKVTIEDNWVIVDIDTPVIESESPDYRKVVQLCEKGKFSEAKPILESLIRRNPANSEYHRIMGQILSEEGDQDQAIDYLIDALRWDAKNHWALIMMGNIFAKYKNDLHTAKKYYDQAVIVNPKDNISVNNIGANLMQQGKTLEAKSYFEKAAKINPEYPNTHFALGMIAEMQDDPYPAFESTCTAIRLSKTHDGLYQIAVAQAIQIAQKIATGKAGRSVVEEYRKRLEKEGGTKVEFIEDVSIPTAAKLEFAENYDRDNHHIRYKPHYPAIEHLIAHELVHLQFVIEARGEGTNLLFIANKKHRSDFRKALSTMTRKLKKMGIPDESVEKYASELFDGLNRQMFNAPIDLFIEDLIHNEFPELRPYQFLSLYTIIQEGIKAVTDKQSIELSPAEILSKSKTLNVVGAMQYKDLYGIDMVSAFKSASGEMQQAQEFYEEYIEYKRDRKPAEEYELMLHWAQDLKLDQYFELVDENEFRNKRTNIDAMLESIEHDPYDLKSSDPYEKVNMEKFQKSQETLGTNMAVVMYMVDALQYFQGKSEEEIKKIAIEIAMQGRQGYSPGKEDYRINLIAGKKFTGYHILAYYYVSWALAIPEMLDSLQLPYHAEYKLATTMHKPE